MQSSTRHQQTSHPRSGEIIAVVIVIVILILILFPRYGVNRENPHHTQCLNNVHQLTLAIQKYQQDHADKFPDKAIVWRDIDYPPKALLCPTYGMKKGLAYGYNASISGKTLKSPGMPEPQDLPVLADSKTSSHLLTSLADIDPRHTQKAVVSYADGHVSLLPLSDIQNVPVKKAR